MGVSKYRDTPKWMVTIPIKIDDLGVHLFLETSIYIYTYYTRGPDRKFPIVPPHLLIPWLYQSGLYPEIDPSELKQYWKHAKRWGLPGAELVSEELEDKTHSFYVWADDAVYTVDHSKLMVLVLGSIHDTRKNSRETCWPLCSIRVDSC